MQNSKRAVYNSMIMYLKMLITMGISLFSTRLILNALGAVDYGIFSVVAGVIALLSFMKSAMMLSSQRYLSYYIGKGVYQKLQTIFSTSILLHLGLAIVIVIALQLVGELLFNDVLQIPEHRFATARLVYHFMVANVFFTIISVPFDALINAYEHLVVIAVVETTGALLKLGVAVYLFFTGFDRLIVYSLLLVAVTIVMLLLKLFWCKKSYPRIRFKGLKGLSRRWVFEMISFAGWNTFGAACGIGRIQGVAVVLNMFFGTIINAAYGVAVQINGQFQLLSVTMMKALNPQIIKSEGSGDRKKMIHLSMLASKFSFFFLTFIALPLIIEMPFVLKVWLNDVPPNAVIFCRLIILLTLINQLGIGLQTAAQAVGNIKWYQIVIGSLILLTLPGGYFLFKNGYPSYSILLLAIIIEIVAVFSRILFLKVIAKISITQYFQKVILKAVLPIFLTSIILFFPFQYMGSDLFRFGLIVVLSSGFLVVFIGAFSLSGYEKTILKNIGLPHLKKIIFWRQL